MKPDRLKNNFLKRLRLKESWLIFFILGIIMLNYPFVHIFNKSTYIFSFPILFIYIYGGWSFSILVIYLFTKSIHTGANNIERNGDT
jgi:hypothetical protein